MQEITLFQTEAKPDKKVKICLPDNFNVEMFSMAADHMSALTKTELENRIDSPVKGDSLNDRIAKAHEVAIVFDDKSRGTPCKQVAEILLERLHKSGIKKEHIRFICATGTHAAMERHEMIDKLGEEIVENYFVFNHNPFSNCINTGLYIENVPIALNQEFMECDLKIAIGMVSPHPLNGYGGGYKIVLPGLASYETILEHHRLRGMTGQGNLATCPFRERIEQLDKIVPDLFLIDTILNCRREIVEVFAGEANACYRLAADTSSKLNATQPITEKKDIVIVNANNKRNEADIAVKMAEMLVKENGTVVLINYCEGGQVIHYTTGTFGIGKGAPVWTSHDKRKKGVSQCVIYHTPFPDKVSTMCFTAPEKMFFAKTWDDVLHLLDTYSIGATVGVLSDGSISYYPHY